MSNLVFHARFDMTVVRSDALQKIGKVELGTERCKSIFTTRAFSRVNSSLVFATKKRKLIQILLSVNASTDFTVNLIFIPI